MNLSQHTKYLWWKRIHSSTELDIKYHFQMKNNKIEKYSQ